MRKIKKKMLAAKCGTVSTYPSTCKRLRVFSTDCGSCITVRTLDVTSFSDQDANHELCIIRGDDVNDMLGRLLHLARC